LNRLQRFRCHNGQCITGKLLCDGRADCRDSSDETVAECKEILCPDYAFRCNYGGCINGDYVCNGIQDCVDNSDETQLLCTSIITNIHKPVHMYTLRLPGRANNSLLNLYNYTCTAPPQPPNGHRTLHPSPCSGEKKCNVSDGTPLRTETRLVFSCNSGYKIKGRDTFKCTENGWDVHILERFIPECEKINCQVLITAVSAIEARCTYDDKWISCETSKTFVPGTKAILDCRNGYHPETNPLSAQGNTVTCNANGEWKPKPMRCVLACGILPPDIKPNIVGGIRPTITEFPWHASLYRDESDKTKKYFCGATIIQERFLITAAHCVFDENTGQLNDASKIYVLVGNLFRDYDYPYHNRILVKYNQVKHIYIARNYLGIVGNYLWDIAILELVRPFVWSTWLIPVCIDTVSDKSAAEVGSYGKVAGFGRTAYGETSAMLQALTVPIIPLIQCISASQDANTRQFITNDKFCAGYRNGSSVCDGDSGGGLVVETNNTWYLRGIVSVSLGTIQVGGIAHCDSNLYTLYTEVSRHIPWIQRVISKVEQDQRHELCSNESYTRCF
ncbi:PREDICTED: limulus clotting factor C-like, partial [Wasmannia auropunctata]|uniref:limulus clotting factor C-like n=1 Tax=Wasmannia auropunctata TaxID=64793 RepID=UPI0005EFA01E